jgi:ergothioneine biosynthesis protein EgtB
LLAVRSTTDRLVEPLSAEDCTVQSMTEASPVKWNLAHTSWFFETFVLVPGLAGYRVFHPHYSKLFNSYYDTVGDRVARDLRGLMTRPGLEEVRLYRKHVDLHLRKLLDGESVGELARVIEIGMHHEQQHQELLLTDIKHALSFNLLRPAYRGSVAPPPRPPAHLTYHPVDAGQHALGHDGSGFAFDNERPRHRVFVEAFELASRPVTNGEFLEFIEDGAYDEPTLWLADGSELVRRHGWDAPLYWAHEDGQWSTYTLGGRRPVDLEEPVTHVSYYEADAFATWAGARLPTEAEWEVVADGTPVEGNFAESGHLHPRPTLEGSEPGPSGLFGDVWEWTSSAYTPYPGYRRWEGALGEYNGKFMSGQMVLRGGSCVSPQTHLRATYRNFFYPDARWQFSGIRLARNV